MRDRHPAARLATKRGGGVFACALVLGGALGAAPALAAAPPPVDLGPTLTAMVGRCWHPPQGASGAVTIRFELGQDGAVVGKPKANGLANAGVAAAAINAVKLCQPYRLPPTRFTDWQHSTVTLTAP
jgi:hypothetical protein